MGLNFRLTGYVSRQYLSTVRLYLTGMEFYSKNQKIAFWVNLWGLRGNVCTPSTACWKAHGQFPICHNWTFSLSLMTEMMKAEICRSQHVSKGVGHFW